MERGKICETCQRRVPPDQIACWECGGTFLKEDREPGDRQCTTDPGAKTEREQLTGIRKLVVERRSRPVEVPGRRWLLWFLVVPLLLAWSLHEWRAPDTHAAQYSERDRKP